MNKEEAKIAISAILFLVSTAILCNLPSPEIPVCEVKLIDLVTIGFYVAFLTGALVAAITSKD